MFLSFASSSVHMMYASHSWSSDRLGLPHPPAWSSYEAVMLCWPLIIMNLPALIASHEVGGSFKSPLFLSTSIRHTFCNCLTSPIWTRVFFMSSTNDLCSVRMIKSRYDALVDVYSCSFHLQQEARLVVLPKFPLNFGEFLEVLRGWDGPGCPCLRGGHARGCSFPFRCPLWATWLASLPSALSVVP